MPGKSKKIKEMGYKSGYNMKPYQMDDPNMMKPYQAHHPMKMNGPFHNAHVKGHRPSILNQMSHNK